MASAVGEMPARDPCVMATAATRHVSAAEELAAAEVATPCEVATATPDLAAPSEVATAASEVTAPSEVAAATPAMAARKRGDRRAGYGHPEQQGCPDPNPSRVRRIHSSSPRRAAGTSRTPALELDAPRALVFKGVGH
jgi:hypothetical protein